MAHFRGSTALLSLMPSATCQRANRSRGAADHFWCQGLCARTVTACARQHFSKEMRRQCSSPALGEGREGGGRNSPLYSLSCRGSSAEDTRLRKVCESETTQQLGSAVGPWHQLSRQSSHSLGKQARWKHRNPSASWCCSSLPRAQRGAWDRQSNKHSTEVLSQSHGKCWAGRDPQGSSNLTPGSAQDYPHSLKPLRPSLPQSTISYSLSLLTSGSWGKEKKRKNHNGQIKLATSRHQPGHGSDAPLLSLIRDI